jgi:hypothetical protein
MANDNRTNDAQALQHPEPPPGLKSLGDSLVGTWEISGGAQRRATYEWMEYEGGLALPVELLP